ncbi:hypothetical protein U1Q18_037289 [Sarracenia purpurea var. burkii]
MAVNLFANLKSQRPVWEIGVNCGKSPDDFAPRILVKIRSSNGFGENPIRRKSHPVFLFSFIANGGTRLEGRRLGTKGGITVIHNKDSQRSNNRGGGEETKGIPRP